ncbi:MAG TPA: tail fiber protein [Verrucomicrobiae bacterium]
MADQYVGEIRVVPFNFAPSGWAFCNGQLIPISQNTALFSLLGTTYGGNGVSNFALPNFQGSAPICVGQGNGLSPYSLGQTGGEAQVTLLTSHLPSHSHAAAGNPGNGDWNTPTNNAWAQPHLGKTPINLYSDTPGAGLAMNALALALAGGGQPHNNMPPFLTLNFIIALTGIFPPRS